MARKPGIYWDKSFLSILYRVTIALTWFALASILVLALLGRVLGWSDQSAPIRDIEKRRAISNAKDEKEGGGGEDPQRNELLTKESVNYVNEAEVDRLEVVWRADQNRKQVLGVIERFREELARKVQAGTVPAKVMQYLHSGAFARRCADDFGCADDMSPAALSLCVQQIQRDMLVGKGASSFGRKKRPSDAAAERNDFSSESRVKAWVEAFGLKSSSSGDEGSETKEDGENGELDDDTPLGLYTSMARTLITGNVATIMLDLEGADPLPNLEWAVVDDDDDDDSASSSLHVDDDDFEMDLDSMLEEVGGGSGSARESEDLAGETVGGLEGRRASCSRRSSELDTLMATRPQGSADLVLEVEGAKRYAGALPDLVQERPSGVDCQRWKHDAHGRLIPLHCSSLALDVQGGVAQEEQPLVLWNIKIPRDPCQLWRLTSEGTLAVRATSSENPGLTLVVGTPNTHGSVSALVGASLVLVPPYSARAIHWTWVRSKERAEIVPRLPAPAALENSKLISTPTTFEAATDDTVARSPKIKYKRKDRKHQNFKETPTASRSVSSNSITAAPPPPPPPPPRSNYNSARFEVDSDVNSNIWSSSRHSSPAESRDRSSTQKRVTPPPRVHFSNSQRPTSI